MESWQVFACGMELLVVKVPSHIPPSMLARNLVLMKPKSRRRRQLLDDVLCHRSLSSGLFRFVQSKDGDKMKKEAFGIC